MDCLEKSLKVMKMVSLVTNCEMFDKCVITKVCIYAETSDISSTDMTLNVLTEMDISKLDQDFKILMLIGFH